MPADAQGAPGDARPNVPLIHRPGEPARLRALDRPPLLERKALLVVDDEPPVLKLVSRVLAADNYEIRSAASGPEALGVLDEPGARVDLLVTDLMMPGMTGVELAAHVRARNPRVRVLYVTGFADNLFAGVRELADGEAFIEKPFGADGLLEAARLLMFGHIATDEAPRDERDDPEKWEDRRWRARFVRLLKRLRIA